MKLVKTVISDKGGIYNKSNDSQLLLTQHQHYSLVCQKKSCINGRTEASSRRSHSLYASRSRFSPVRRKLISSARGASACRFIDKNHRLCQLLLADYHQLSWNTKTDPVPRTVSSMIFLLIVFLDHKEIISIR